MFRFRLDKYICDGGKDHKYQEYGCEDVYLCFVHAAFCGWGMHAPRSSIF